MDSWLTDETKELFFQPCLKASGHIGRRLSNRLKMGQTIDERALTEDFVDLFDTSSNSNAWGSIINELREKKIYLNTSIQKSKNEHKIGADIGFTINRQFYGNENASRTKYSCLVQCKKIDGKGMISDFYHEVQSSGEKQSSLMLNVTSSSFYFIFIAPTMLKHYCNFEPIAFLNAGRGCSVPIWNNGCFGFEGQMPPFLSGKNKEEVTGILVVPALAVEAQQNGNRKEASIIDILPNCMPLWYWFGELLIPGFIGDRRDEAVSVALNKRGEHLKNNIPFGVNYSVEVSFGNG